MKIKVEIDAEEIFDEGCCDDENCEKGGVSVAGLIKDQVVYETKNAILKKISDDARVEMQTQASKAILEAMKLHISNTITSYLANLKVYSQYGSKVEVSVEEYLKERFERELQGRNVGDMVEKIANNYVATIKERYDKLFAAQLLDKMLKSGLLKEEAISKLLISD